MTKRRRSQVRWVTVTPEHAQLVLMCNTNNRYLDKTTWRRYGEDMMTDRWQDNGEVSVQVSGTWDDPGEVLNGQHKLTAIAHYGITIDLLIAEHVNPATYVTMDSGKPRSLAHDLQREGVKDASNVAAAVRLSYLWAKGDPRSRIKITRQDISPYWQEHRDIVDSSVRARRFVRHLRVSRSVLAAFHYRVRDIDPEDAETFLIGLQDGAELAHTSPILHCRNRLVDFAMHDSFPEQDVVLGYLITAWNLWRDGYKVESVTYKPGRSEYPEPK